LGKNLTGDNILEPYKAGPRKFIQELMDNLLKTPCCGFLERKIYSSKTTYYTAEALHLPLVNEYGDVKYLYGVIDLDLSKNGFEPPVMEDLINNSKLISAEYMDLGAGIPQEAPDISLFNN
jgi:hypothetical protein